MGFDHIVQIGERFDTMPWMAWSPKGDRLAYFVRTEKERDADHPERADQQDRRAHPDEVGRRARVADFLARRPDDRVRRRCAAASATSSRSTSTTKAGHQPHRRRLRRLRRRPTRPTASSSSTTRASAATRSCSASISTPRRRRSSPSAPGRDRGAVHRRPHASCSRRRPPTRRCRSSPKWRRTATSTTSGRST